MKKKEDKKTNKYYEAFGSFSFDEYKNHESFTKKLGIEMLPQETPKALKINSLNRTRLIFGFLVLIVLMLVLVFRMAYWQIIKSDELKEKATSMQKVDTEIDSVRGTIYDSRKSVLAETVTEYELYGYTQYMYKSKSLSESEKEATVNNLCKLTGEDKDVIISRLEGDDNLALLGEGLTREDVDKAEKLWEGNVMVKTKISRYYPNGAFASQILGGVNDENTGRTGLEYEYNSVLAGIKGRTVKTTDSQGNTLANGNSKY